MSSKALPSAVSAVLFQSCTTDTLQRRILALRQQVCHPKLLMLDALLGSAAAFAFSACICDGAISAM